MIDAKYSRKWRTNLGFTNQEEFKKYFKAKDKDLKPKIDFDYIEKLNIRIIDIIKKISKNINFRTPVKNIDFFINDLKNMQSKIVDEKISTMVNQGRRKEEVYFSWMRGYAISTFFIPSIEYIFDSKVKLIGGDTNDEWSRKPTADFEVEYNNQKIRLEIQSGFQGINDIKRHKIEEARKELSKNIKTFVIHFDLFNGYASFVDVSSIEETDINWVRRTMMEGQEVFSIPAQNFIWKLSEAPLKFKDIINLLTM